MTQPEYGPLHRALSDHYSIEARKVVDEMEVKNDSLESVLVGLLENRMGSTVQDSIHRLVQAIEAQTRIQERLALAIERQSIALVDLVESMGEDETDYDQDDGGLSHLGTL